MTATYSAFYNSRTRRLAVTDPDNTGRLMQHRDDVAAQHVPDMLEAAGYDIAVTGARAWRQLDSDNWVATVTRESE